MPVRKSEIVWKTLSKDSFLRPVAGFRGKVDEGESRITDAKCFVFFNEFSLLLVCIWCALASERRLLTMTLVPKSEMISSWRSTRSLC